MIRRVSCNKALQGLFRKPHIIPPVSSNTNRGLCYVYLQKSPGFHHSLRHRRKFQFDGKTTATFVSKRFVNKQGLYNTVWKFSNFPANATLILRQIYFG